jgi:hypothetical protein
VNQVFHSFDLSTVVRIWIVSCLGFEGFVVCPRCAVENLERCFFCLISVNLFILHGILILIISRVVDPYSFFPDPEFDVGDQYGSGSGSNTDPGL